MRIYHLLLILLLTGNTVQAQLRDVLIHTMMYYDNVRGIDSLLKNGYISRDYKDESENGLLHLAESPKMMKYLLDAGYRNIEEKNKMGRTPLNQHATKKEVVQLLLAAGADVNTRDANKMSPLQHSIYKNSPELLRIFLDTGADPESEDYNGATTVMSAVRAGYVDLVKILVEERHVQLDKTSVNDGNAFDMACQNDYADPKFLAYLMEKYPFPLNGNSRFIPLVEAIRSGPGSFETVYFLVKKGAFHPEAIKTAVEKKKCLEATLIECMTDSDGSKELQLYADIAKRDKKETRQIKKSIKKTGADFTNQYGVSLLHWAASNAQTELIDFLVDRKADVNACDSAGKTALFYAVASRHELAVKTLLRHGAKVSMIGSDALTEAIYSKTIRRDETAERIVTHLIDATNATDKISAKALRAMMKGDIVRKGDIELFDRLLQKRRPNKDIDSILLTACEWGTEEMVKSLLKEGADCDAETKGNYPIIVAAGRGNEHTVKILIDAGANINVINEDGYSALELNVIFGILPRVMSPVPELLIRNGADIYKKSEHNESFFPHLCYTEDYKLIFDLVDNKGLSVNLLSYHGETPLMIAAKKGDDYLIDFLIERGADVNTQDRENSTPIMYAAAHGHVSSMKKIYEADPTMNLNFFDDNNRNVLSWAISENQKEVVEELMHWNLDFAYKNDYGNYWYLVEALHHEEIYEIIKNKIRSIIPREEFEKIKKY